MLYLNSKEDIPEIEDMHNKISELMENRGIRISNNIFKEKKELDQNKEQLIKFIQKTFGINNPNSTKEWQSFLNLRYSDDEVVCAELYNDSKDSWTTDGKKLAKLAHIDNITYSFALNLIRYRKVKKYCETIDGLLKYCDKYGVVHPKISAGKTNRINYKDPALMNIPKKLLWKVIAPYKDGNILISVDIKNQEPWILINMLGIQELKEIIMNDPAGLYNGIYDRVYGGQPSEIERQELKTSWNAMTYGATKHGVLETCMNIDGEKLYKYFNHFKELKEYTSRCYAMAKSKKRTVSTLFGTELVADGATPGIIRRQLMDLPIQGTGSDILALIIENFYNYVKAKDLFDKIMLYYPRHDEVILEVDRLYYEEQGEEAVFNTLRTIFEHKIDNWEPFKVEINRVDLLATSNDAETDEDEE